MLGGRSLALALCLLLPVLAQAQADSDVEALLRKGIELRKNGDDDGAYEVFLRAFQTEPSPRAGAQLGLVEQALGDWVHAEEHLGTALAAWDDPWIARNRPDLEQAARYVRRHLGKLDVAGADGTELRVNGRDVGRLPLGGPLRVAVGVVILEARLPGRAATLRTTTIRAGELTRERFDDAPNEPTSPTVAVHPLKEPVYKKWWLWSIVGIAAVGVAVGVGLGVALSSTDNSYMRVRF
jgi:hypothetical protein